MLLLTQSHARLRDFNQRGGCSKSEKITQPLNAAVIYIETITTISTVNRIFLIAAHSRKYYRD